MMLSFTLVACSTVSCIIGSLYYLHISPIDINNPRLLTLILFLQVSCAHSTLSSAEFIIKQREENNQDSLINLE